MNLADCISKIKQGDQAQFKLLYQHYAPLFKGIAYRYTADADVANDMLQETFIKIFKSIASYTGEGNFEGWMKRILVNNCLNYIKKEKKYSFEVAEVLVNQPSQNWDEALNALSFDEIVTIINLLPVGYKTVFNLNVFEGYSHKEIGEMLNISESASRSQLTKAKFKIKQELKKINVFSSIA